MSSTEPVVSTSSRPRLLVLNVEVSGMNRYLYAALRRDWDISLFEMPEPRLVYSWGKVVSFRPSLNAWRRNLDRYIERVSKSATMFRWRTRRFERELRRRRGTYDVVLQLSGMYAPSEEPLPCPYVVLTSFTLRLAEREYPAWAPFPTRRASDAWFALERGLYHQAACVLTTNDHARRSIVEDYGLAAERTATVGYGIPLDRLPTDLPTYDGRTILFVGKDFERKGGFVLLEAFARVRQAHPQARLVVVGPPPDRIGRPDPGVEWMGPVRDRAVVAALYRQAHVFAMPSLCDPFGLVFLEAMAHALPCVGTAVDAMPEIIEDRRTGFLVPPADAAALADRLAMLLDDPPLAQAMGERGRERATSSFSWETMAGRITWYLQATMRGDSSAGGMATLPNPVPAGPR